MENTQNSTPPVVSNPMESNPPESAPAPAPAPAVNNELPKNTGKTVGGWNRFAGYNPNEAKNKQGRRDKDRGPRKRG